MPTIATDRPSEKLRLLVESAFVFYFVEIFSCLLLVLIAPQFSIEIYDIKIFNKYFFRIKMKAFY
ncbi:hypothetical protein [Photorhabdus laumondii]